MAETLVEKGTGNDLLRQYLASHKVPVARSANELYIHSVKDDDGQEIERFLELLNEWRRQQLDEHRRLD